MWLLVGGLALAGLRADIGAATRGSPDAAVACTSARTAWSLLGQVLEPAAEQGPMSAQIERVFRPGAADALFDEDARLAVAWWRDGGRVQIGFDTRHTAEEVARAFAGLDQLDAAEVLEGPEGWVVRSGDELRQVRVADGWARIFDEQPPTDAVRVLPKGLVDAMPEDPGCVAMLHLPNEEMGEMDVGVHLPFTRGSPTTFALAGPPVDAFGGMLLRAGSPPDVRTPQRPEALAVLGVGIDSIDFSAFLTGKELRRARRVQNLFPVTAGTTVALLATEPAPVLAAVLPLPERLAPRAIARRARKLLARHDVAVERLDGTHFRVEAGPAPLHFAARRGGLLVASDADALAAMEAGDGEAWVDGRVAELAERYPFVVSTHVLPGGEGMPFEHLDQPATLGLDLKPGILTGVVFLPFSFEEFLHRAREPQAAAPDPVRAFLPDW
ncbi:MAG: hypothetical protein ACOZNI_31565 [Myxococcota bacterium]